MLRRSLLLALGSAAAACSSERPREVARLGLGREVRKRSDALVPLSSPAALRTIRDRLAPLHVKVGKPQPGDWLHDHPEGGQSFEEYLVSQPTLPTESRRTIVVAPLGAMPAASLEIVALTTEYMGLHFGLPVRLGAQIALAPPEHARRQRDGAEQVLTRWVLDKVLPKELPGDAAALIGLTANDLWPGEGWNFVFGEATFSERVGVWSLHRFGDPAKGEAARREALRRALKIAVHEAGHMFSLPHCTKYPCVQAGTNSLEETDRSPLWLCAECLPKIAWAMQMDPRVHLKRTQGFCAQHGLEEEAAFLERELATIA